MFLLLNKVNYFEEVDSKKKVGIFYLKMRRIENSKKISNYLLTLLKNRNIMNLAFINLNC